MIDFGLIVRVFIILKVFNYRFMVPYISYKNKFESEDGRQKYDELFRSSSIDLPTKTLLFQEYYFQGL